MTPARDGNWQTLTAENSGLPANHVSDIAEDADGNLWFATYGGGLCRCSADGEDWQTYRAADGPLVNDYVGIVTVDATGRVWAVCDPRQVDGVKYPGGICVRAPEGTWQTYERPASERCIVALEADRDGTVWLRCNGWVLGDALTMCEGTRSGPDRFQVPNWQSFDGTSWGICEGDRIAIAAWYPHRPASTRLGWVLEGDTVWFLETVKFDVGPPAFGMVEGANLPQGFPSLGIGGIPGMGSFCCYYDLVSYDGQEWKKRARVPSPFRYGELAMDGEGRKWVSLLSLGDIVTGGGLARLDREGDDEENKGEWTIFNKENGLLSDYVLSLSADSRGNLWASQAWGGLSRWDGSGWTHFPSSEDRLGREDLGRCTEDQQGRLWFPSKAGALVYTP